MYQAFLAKERSWLEATRDRARQLRHPDEGARSFGNGAPGVRDGGMLAYLMAQPLSCVNESA